MSYKYTGRIFKIPFPFTDLSGSKARPAMALSEPDKYGDIAFAFITTRHTRKSEFALDIPQGLLPFESRLHLDKVFLLNKEIILKEIVRAESDFLEQVLKNLTLIDTQRYFENIHKPLQDRPFIPGKSRINYAGRVYDEKEMINLVDASLDFWLTAGRYDREFCEKLSVYLNTADLPDVKSITVNSGSSANLLAIGSLASPKLGELKLSEGDEVITVAAGFPTSIAPIVQNSLVPVFVDVELGSYNIDSGKIEEAISEKTKAIFFSSYPWNAV